MSNILIQTGTATHANLANVFAATVKQPKNTPPYYADLPIAVLDSILGQRATKAKTIEKHLKAEDGFDWNLWRPISVAKWKDETGLEVYRRWDGDHRFHMWNIVFPNAETIPCIVYEVANESVANSLFVKIQSSRQKNLTVEEVFVNDVLAKDPSALQTAAAMAYCDVCVQLDDAAPPQFPVGTTVPVGSKSRFTTKVRRFKDSVALQMHSKANPVKGSPTTGVEFTKLAATVIRDVWGTNETAIRPDTLYGIALLFSYYPTLAAPQYLPDFITFLRTFAGNRNSATVTSGFKQTGGNVHNHEGESIALGLATELKQDVVYPAYPKKFIMIKSIKDDMK
ncbi:hypothetical protein D3C72_1265440 [compost metagenome]